MRLSDDDFVGSMKNCTRVIQSEQYGELLAVFLMVKES